MPFTTAIVIISISVAFNIILWINNRDLKFTIKKYAHDKERSENEVLGLYKSNHLLKEEKASLQKNLRKVSKDRANLKAKIIRLENLKEVQTTSRANRRRNNKLNK